MAKLTLVMGNDLAHTTKNWLILYSNRVISKGIVRILISFPFRCSDHRLGKV